MFFRRESWAQLTRSGLPNLVTLRPMGNFTPRNQGDSYHIENPLDKREIQRARQLYEMRRIGTEEELKLYVAKSDRFAEIIQQKEVANVASQ